MTIKYDLQTIKSVVETALDKVESTPNETAFVDLLRELRQLDVNYQQFCNYHDNEMGYPIGSTYNNGISIEWEIEADWWHRISEILRNI